MKDLGDYSVVDDNLKLRAYPVFLVVRGNIRLFIDVFAKNANVSFV